MINEEIQFIKKNFQVLSENHPEKLEIEEIFDEEEEIIIPQNMKESSDSTKWMLIESDVSEEDIINLEKEFKIKLPLIYKTFISSYFHMFEELDGVFDDFYDEDDREVCVSIIPQPSDKPLAGIAKTFEACRELLNFGYIPIGDFNYCGPLCIDTVNNDELVWLDHEEYYKCKTREELEKLSVKIFNNFRQFMECFFGGITHNCGV